MDRLRYIREQAGYSQQDLADESGVSQHTISEIELGRRKPQGRTLRKLAASLGVEVADLLGAPEHPLVQAPPSPEQPPLNGFNSLEEVRRGATLRSQINFVNNLADYVEQEVEEREQELKSKTSLNRKIKRNTNANWALAMMHVAAELSIAFVEDPNMKDLAYDTGEVVELYKAHRRLDTAIEPTRVWFGNEEPTNVSEIEAYRRTRQARDQMMERRRSAGA